MITMTLSFIQRVSKAIVMIAAITSIIPAQALDSVSAFNQWRSQMFGINYLTNPDASPTADPDGDGATNFQEFLAGTNPLDARSVSRTPNSVSTFAGSQPGDRNGFRTDAQFNVSVPDLVIDSQRNIWIPEGNIGGINSAGPGKQRIRMIDPTGLVSTFAGSDSGFADGLRSTALFGSPRGLAFDRTGNLFVLDRVNHAVRKIDPKGVVTTFAGSSPGFRDGIGTNAQFNVPLGIAIDAEDNLYVADWMNLAIRKITPAGSVTTYAGGQRGFADGNRSSAQFNSPNDVAIGLHDELYVSDWSNGAIRKIDTNGLVSTVAQGMPFIERVSVDREGNVYGSAAGAFGLYKYNPLGVLQWSLRTPPGYQDGPFTNAQFQSFGRVAELSSGDLLVTDASRVRMISLAPPPVLTVTPSSGLFTNQVSVSMQSSAPTALIHYTLDGSAPAKSSPTYSQTIVLTQSTVVKAQLFLQDLAVSDVIERHYTPYLPGPSISLSPVSATVSQNNAAFAIATISGGNDLKLSGASDNPALVPDANIVFGGTGNLRSVAIIPAPGANNQNSRDRGANITVTVSDPNGTSASASFLLNVISGNSLPAGPTLSAIPDQETTRNKSTPPAAFIAADPDNPSVPVAVSAKSSDPDLVSDSHIYITGNGSARSIYLTPNFNATGTVTVTVTARDLDDGLSATTSFKVTIDSAAPGSRPSSDFEGDGYAALVLEDSDGFVGAWSMAGAKVAKASYFSPNSVGDPNWRVVSMGDFNGDGKLDILFQHTDGTLALWYMDGLKLNAATLLTPNNPGDPKWHAITVADINNDGKPDILFQHEDGTLAAWIMDGATMTAGKFFVPNNVGDRNWQLVGAGDFNSDKKADLVFQHADGSLAIWLMDGLNLSQSVLVNPVTPGDAKWRVVSVTDLDGDLNSDLVFEYGDGTLATWFMKGTNLRNATLLNPSNARGSWKIVAP